MPEGRNPWFQRVPESKVGATFVSDFRNPDGTGWVVPADPEGNEFCVLRSNAEREAFRTPTTPTPATT
jgi:hypothetical protein